MTRKRSWPTAAVRTAFFPTRRWRRFALAVARCAGWKTAFRSGARPGRQQADKKGRLREPPSEQGRASLAPTIARAVDDLICHPGYPTQQEATPVSPDRSACTGGQATEP